MADLQPKDECLAHKRHSVISVEQMNESPLSTRLNTMETNLSEGP